MLTTPEDLDLDVPQSNPSPDEVGTSATPFTPPVSLGASLPPLAGLDSMQHQQFQPLRQQQQRRTSGISVYASLESMYSSIPELGSDQARLRVERTEPESMPDGSGGRIPVAGIIAYLQDTLSTEEFANRFGGRKYRVYAEKLVEDKTSGNGQRFVDVAFSEFRFPLDPNLEELPILREEDGMDPMSMMLGGDPPYRRFSSSRRGAMFFQPPAQPQPASTILDAVREGAKFASSHHQVPRDDSSTLQFLSGLSQEQVRAAREYADRQSEFLQRQLEAREHALQEIREEMRMMRDRERDRPTSQGETLSGIAQVLGAMRGSAGEQEASVLRASHDREIDRLTRQHQAEKESMRRDFEREVASIRASMDSEKARWSDRERDQAREAERREQIARDEMERRERSTKNDAEREVSMLKSAYEAQIASMRNSYEERLKMLEMHAGVLQKQSETTASVEIRTLQREVATLSAEKEAIRREADELRAKVNKTPIEAIQEAHQLAEMTGMQRAGSDSSEPDTRSSTDKIIDGLAEGISKSAPAIMAGLSGVAQSLVASKQQQQNPAVLPPRQGRVVVQQQQPQRRLSGPRFVDSDAPPMDTPNRDRDPIEEPKPATQVQSTPQVPTRPETAPPPPPPANVWEGFEWTSLEPDALYGICATIENTISEGGTPKDARDKLSAAIGEDTLTIVGQFAEAEKVVASMARAPATKNSLLNSTKGRKFIRELWAMLAPKEEGASS